MGPCTHNILAGKFRKLESNKLKIKIVCFNLEDKAKLLDFF